MIVTFRGVKTFIFFWVLLIGGRPESWGSYAEWRQTGPGGGGAVQAFGFDPVDQNRVYLTSDMVGVFVSDDSGDHWRWSSYGASNQLGGIAVDPDNPDLIYVVGPKGIYQSTDKAKHWHLVYSKGNGFRGVNNESFWPLRKSIFGTPGQSIGISSTGVVYVCTEAGDVIVSRSKGRTWSRVSVGGNSSVINVIPVYGKKVVSAFAADGIYLSMDEGYTWSKTLSSGGGHLLTMAAHPVNRDILYALVSKHPVPADQYTRYEVTADLFQSRDSGSTWEVIHNFKKIILSRGRRRIDVGKDGTLVLLTAQGPIRSLDGGKTWSGSQIEGRRNDAFIYNELKGKPDGPLSIYADPRETGRWYMTDMLSAYRSDDNGGTWHYIVDGLREQAYWFVKVNPKDPSRVIASDLDHGLIASSDGGDSWRNVIIENPYEECDELRFSPDDVTAKILYAFFFYPYPYIAKSPDAGETWSVLKRWKEKKDKYQPMNGFCLTGGEKFPVMYVGEPNVGIWKSVDDGKSWINKSSGLPQPEEIAYIQFLESDKRGYIYVGIASEKRGKGGIFRSTDGGENWVSLNRGLEGLWPRRKSFEIDPNNPDILWVGSGRAVYRSIDAGMSWEKRIDGVFASAILVEPGNSDAVYVASFSGGGPLEQYSEGIYKSVDGGNYFFRISGDLFKTIGSSYRIYDFEYGWKGPGIIWAAPNGGGLIYTVSPFSELR